MKKLLLLACMMVSAGSVKANQPEKNPQEIFEKFFEQTGIPQQKEGFKSVMIQLEGKAMGISVPVKIVIKGTSYRVELSMMDKNVMIVGNLDEVYITADGNTQRIENTKKEMMVEMMEKMKTAEFGTLDYNATLKYVGQDGRGKKLCDIIEIQNETALFKIYFNAESGLMTKLEVENTNTTECEDGCTHNHTPKVELEIDNYKQFASGALLLPSKLSLKAEGQKVNIHLQEIALDYPTAPWMFAFPRI